MFKKCIHCNKTVILQSSRTGTPLHKTCHAAKLIVLASRCRAQPENFDFHIDELYMLYSNLKKKVKSIQKVVD